jgi:betaine-aldehyde dehydrogenase
MDEAKLQECLPKSRGLFYNGEFHEPKDGEFKETISAVNGKPLVKVALAGRGDTVACLESAQSAFETWKKVSTIERCNLLRKTAQIIRDHADELATLDSWDIGTPKAILLGECEYAARNLDLVAGLAPALTGKTYNLTDDMFHHTLREPLGVVARIVAYNHPLLMVAAKMAPAVVVGNTVVIKAAEQAPLSALRFAELIQNVFPPGVVNVLCGGKECGEVLSSHPIVKRVTLVGSVPIGRLIAKSASDTLKLTTFELGGKNALVAYPDADIPSLVEGIVKGMNWGMF